MKAPTGSGPTTVPQTEVLTATLLAGLICAGTFTMASMPSAALLFVGLILTARILHIALSPVDHMPENLAFQAICGSVMLVSLRSMAQLFIDRVRAVSSAQELGLEAQAQARLEEKQREEWIRGRTQWRFARWGSEHIGAPAALAARLAAFGIRAP